MNEKAKKEKKLNRNVNIKVINIVTNDPPGLLLIQKMKIMIVKRINMVNMHRMNDQESITTRGYECEHPKDSRDIQKKLEWVSALKWDQLKKYIIKAKESQQPPMADSEEMLDEPTTS
uniref:Uncharacterized protein n=1 Tax=Romanomermis culicivorax TaxID=13658 RepID=A0A915KBK4_ROMCU